MGVGLTTEFKRLFIFPLRFIYGYWHVIHVASFFTGFLVDFVFNNSSAPYTFSLITVGATGIIAIICFYIAGFSYSKDSELAKKN